MEHTYDVIIVGASFSGLTLAHHLPNTLRVLVIDSKPTAGATVESTGLITQKTRDEFASFFDIDTFITNPITSICVMAPDFENHFVSKTTHPWIYQTDTKGLVRALADRLPSHVTFLPATTLTALERDGEHLNLSLFSAGTTQVVRTRFCVGADGSRSKVAALTPALDQNKKFLFGYEQVFFGNVHLGPQPEETIYHFWFGEFSLGYGGWLSPTTVNGKPAFRIGLAKLLKDRGDAKQLIEKFIQILCERRIITIEGDPQKPDYVFGSMIPIGGTLKRIHDRNVLLIGDAAGFCGAFAADGIKGSVISGKEAAKLIPRYLNAEQDVLRQFRARINSHGNLMDYYRRQVHYRWVWDAMKRNQTFHAMYHIIAAEQHSFLNQFCDSKDKKRSLAWVVLKIHHIPKLLIYAAYVVYDQLRPPPSISRSS